MEENEEVESEPIDIELNEQNFDSEIMKMQLTLNDQVQKKKSRKILLWLTLLRAYKSKMIRKIFQKSNYMIA